MKLSKYCYKMKLFLIFAILLFGLVNFCHSGRFECADYYFPDSKCATLRYQVNIEKKTLFLNCSAQYDFPWFTFVKIYKENTLLYSFTHGKSNHFNVQVQVKHFTLYSTQHRSRNLVPGDFSLLCNLLSLLVQFLNLTYLIHTYYYLLINKNPFNTYLYLYSH